MLRGHDGRRAKPVMSFKPGQHNVFCLFCRRMWSAVTSEEYESREIFDRSNLLACPWCGHRTSMAERPGHKEEAVNGFAFPSREQLDKMNRTGGVTYSPVQRITAYGLVVAIMHLLKVFSFLAGLPHK